MNAKECDRCHKLYKDTIEERVKHLEQNKNREVTITIEHANAYQTIEKLDLCPDCTKELFEWLDSDRRS